MSLVLDSLEIKNFRAFKHLRIEKLGRVNLIVGKNNVGKSSVLEALWLYAAKGEIGVIMQLIQERDELKSTDEKQASGPSTSSNNLAGLKHLFFGRTDLLVGNNQISVGSLADGQDAVVIGIAPAQWVASGSGRSILKLVEENEISLNASLIPSVTINIGDKMKMHFPLDQSYKPERSAYQPVKLAQLVIGCVIVSADSLTASDVGFYWDNIVLSDLQDDVISALKIIAPSVISINLIGSQNGGSDRTVIVKVTEFNFPIPLRSMGEGMNRMLGIALALVNAKDGMLLIDEVDTGLHYSVLPDLWKLIFEVAHRLNVQVFATSHSWDCIQAFQQAAAANKDEEGILVRLEIQDGEVVPVIFDKRKLNIATREHIEVR